MSDIDDILSGGAAKAGKKTLSEERLLAYLEGRLTAEEQHEVELWMAEDGMEADALEGWSETAPAEARQMAARANRKLAKTLANKKKKRRPQPDSQYALIAIAIIIMLAVLGFVLIKMAG